MFESFIQLKKFYTTNFNYFQYLQTGLLLFLISSIYKLASYFFLQELAYWGKQAIYKVSSLCPVRRQGLLEDSFTLMKL